MTEPRRLNQSGGISQRLLESASLDKPSAASRRHAVNLAATAGAFSRTAAEKRGGGATSRRGIGKTLATWTLIGAAASLALAFTASRYFATTEDPRQSAAPLDAPGTTPGEIAAEPAVSGEIAPEPVLSAQAARRPAPSASVAPTRTAPGGASASPYHAPQPAEQREPSH